MTDDFHISFFGHTKNNDQKQLQKLYASAKRSKHVDFEKVKGVLTCKQEERGL